MLLPPQLTVSYVPGMILSTFYALFQLIFNNPIVITHPQLSDEDTKAQGTNWSKLKQGSSRMRRDHPKVLTTLLFYTIQQLLCKEWSS